MSPRSKTTAIRCVRNLLLILLPAPAFFGYLQAGFWQASIIEAARGQRNGYGDHDLAIRVAKEYSAGIIIFGACIGVSILMLANRGRYALTAIPLAIVALLCLMTSGEASIWFPIGMTVGYPDILGALIPLAWIGLIAVLIALERNENARRA